MSNEKLREALDAALNKQPLSDGKKGDVELTDEDLDDVAGGCGAMCGSFLSREEAV